MTFFGLPPEVGSGLPGSALRKRFMNIDCALAVASSNCWSSSGVFNGGGRFLRRIMQYTANGGECCARGKLTGIPSYMETPIRETLDRATVN